MRPRKAAELRVRCRHAGPEKWLEAESIAPAASVAGQRRPPCGAVDRDQPRFSLASGVLVSTFLEPSAQQHRGKHPSFDDRELNAQVTVLASFSLTNRSSFRALDHLKYQTFAVTVFPVAICSLKVGFCLSGAVPANQSTASTRCCGGPSKRIRRTPWNLGDRISSKLPKHSRGALGEDILAATAALSTLPISSPPFSSQTIFPFSLLLTCPLPDPLRGVDVDFHTIQPFW